MKATECPRCGGVMANCGAAGETEMYCPKCVVQHPDHYTWIPGIECADVVAHFPFFLGNAIKYIWRAGKKGKKIEDLEKAKECIDLEISFTKKVKK